MIDAALFSAEIAGKIVPDSNLYGKMVLDNPPKPAFLDKVIVKSKLRRTKTFVRGEGVKKQWDINRFKHPRPGVIIGFRTLSNGESEYSNNDPVVYHPKRYFKALLVVLDEKHKPVYVLPEEVYTAAHGKDNIFSMSEVTKTCA